MWTKTATPLAKPFSVFSWKSSRIEGSILANILISVHVVSRGE
jgi:hypothetical protein